MYLIRESYHQVAWEIGRLGYPAHSATFIVKGTYDLRPGTTVTPAVEQPELTGDVHVDDDPTAALRYPSDFGYFKPRADVTVVGRFHSANGRLVDRGAAAIQVGTVRKTVAVFGDRFWQTTGGVVSATSPKPFVEIPLSYENSFGGQAHAANPVGKGAAPRVLANGTRSWPLPNVENPRQLIASRESAPAPAGFGPLNLMWQQRMAKAGTYDEKWKRERWPWLPVDLDWTFFNAAPDDQQSEFLKGDEKIRLENLHPKWPVYQASLPAVRVRCFYSPVIGAPLYFDEVRMNLDTVTIDAEAETLVLLWRGFVPLRGDALGNDDRVLVAAEAQHEAPRSIDYYERVCAARIEQLENGDVGENVAAVDSALPVVVDAAGPVELEEETDEALTAAIADFEGSVEPPSEEPEEPERDRAWCLAHYATGASFEGLDLSGADLSDASWPGADFSNAVLTEAFFRRADLQGANFSGAMLSDCDLSGADLRTAVLAGADLTSARLNRCNLDRAVLSGADFSRARLRNAQLRGATATNALFVEADLFEANLAGADLTGADLSRSSLHLIDLTGSTMIDASIEGASAFPMRAPNANLTRLRAAGAVLWESDFHGAVAPGSVWEAAELRDSDFRGADLSRAELENASLPGADLTCAVLRHARLVSTDLRSARLVNCDLLGASLEKADLTDAVVTDASLFKVEILDTDLTAANLDRSNVKRTMLDTR